MIFSWPEQMETKIIKNGPQIHIYLENQNSETTFISSTLKVEEKKVVSEF